MKYSYYPGCSLKGMGMAYEESFLEVMKALDVEAEELADWNCCGATAYMSVDEGSSFALAARNLAMAEKTGLDIVAPCAGCYLVLNKTNRSIEKYENIKQQVTTSLGAIGMEYKGKATVRHPLDVLVNDIGLEKIKEKVQKPLKELKVASYYGCQIVRPIADFDNAHNPMTMDTLMQAAGADVVHSPMKTKCCGGSLVGTLPEVGQRLSYDILRDMKKRGAEVIVTACPLCQFNLGAYQTQISQKQKEEINIPVLHFTQLLGYALGIPGKKLGLKRQIVSADKILKKTQLIAQRAAH